MALLNRWLLTFGLVIFSPWGVSFAQSLELDKAQLAWLQSNVLPLDTTVPAASSDDLAPIASIVGDARTVGLGEATHGTREFYELRHRLTRFLVEEMGFSIIAIEEPMLEAYRLNAYLTTGQGEPEALLQDLPFFIHRHEEMLEFVKWLRGYNASGRGQVLFIGVDVQGDPRLAVQTVRDFVKEVEPAYYEELIETYSPVERWAGGVIEGKTSSDELWRWERRAREVLAHLEANRDTYLKTSPPETVAWAIQNARLVLQNARYHLKLTNPRRDEMMVENVAWLLEERPDAKLVLWAHNGHVKKTEYGFLNPSMGQLLSEQYGEDYVSVGFAFYEGRYLRRVLGEGLTLTVETATPARPGNIGAALNVIGLPLFMLDVKQSARSASASWVNEPHFMRQVGAVAARTDIISLAEAFDVLIFVRNMTPTRPL